MGVASLYDRMHVTHYELQAEWACLPVQIHWRLNAGSECEPHTIELVKVTTTLASIGSVNITSDLSEEFIFSVLEEEVDQADYHWTDHGDV